jgi:hypothetical protein
MATQTREIRPSAGRVQDERREHKVRLGRLLMVGSGTALATTVANVLIAVALRGWLRVPAVFTPLSVPSVASLTILSMGAAVLVFALLARSRPHPVRTFCIVAAIALPITWIPDLLIWVAGVFPGTTAGGILSLMLLHLVAAGLAVILLGRYALPPVAGAAR